MIWGERSNVDVISNQSRNADPAAAKGAYDAVFSGHSIGFTENIGMYMRPLAREVFVHNNQTIPSEWIKYTRGEQGMYQRMSFGPPDHEEIFLDDILILEGATATPITGGYQIARRLEVGPAKPFIHCTFCHK